MGGSTSINKYDKRSAKGEFSSEVYIILHNILQNILYKILHNIVHNISHNIVHNISHNIVHNALHNIVHNALHNMKLWGDLYVLK